MEKQTKKPNFLLLAIIIIVVFLILPIVIYILSSTPSPEDAAQETIDQKIATESNDYSSKYPITSILPHIGEGFRIDYGLCEATTDPFCIRVSALSSGLKNAIDFLLNLDDYDFADYKIEFPDFVSPFSKESIDISSLKPIHLEGNYYGALISFENYEGTTITYRMLLEKTNSSYKILSEPKLLFSYSDLNLKKSIIAAINHL